MVSVIVLEQSQIEQYRKLVVEYTNKGIFQAHVAFHIFCEVRSFKYLHILCPSLLALSIDRSALFWLEGFHLNHWYIIIYLAAFY